MKQPIIIAAGVVLLAAASPSSASDLSGKVTFHPPEGFRIKYVSQLGKGERSDVLRSARDEKVRQLQHDLAADPEVARELRAHHVPLEKVIGSTKTMSGVIYYVK